MQTILITGGTGLVGRALAKALVQKGNSVIVLTRKIPEAAAEAGIRYALWDSRKNYIDPAALVDTTAIIHLAGAGVVDKKWTPGYREEILKSRVDSSALIIQSLKTLPHKVHTMISSSAIGFYGADKDPVQPFTEEDSPATDFLGETCRLWEASVEPVKQMNIRLVKFRIGVVLAAEGGAFKEFIRPIRFRLAAVLGNGAQVVSWIHIADLCRLFIYALEKESLNGTFNAVAPLPVSNKQLILTLAKKIWKKGFILCPVPTFIIRLMLGKRSVVVLKSATASCEKIEREGFTFGYPDIDNALGDLVAPKDRSL